MGEKTSTEPAPRDDLEARLQRVVGGAYSIIRRIPGGGMSIVFLATEHALNRTVAIKVLPRELASRDAVQRFRHEISLAATLQHPNIVPVLTAGEVDGLPYFVMPFVHGESLRSRMARGPMSVRETVMALIDVSRALATAHEHGVVHRDIKPGNILLTGSSAMVADFGVAKAMTLARPRSSALAGVTPGPATVDGTSSGTPAYMAPEQAAADPNSDHRADIYALGVVAYEMLTGSPPFLSSSPREMLVAQLTDAPRPMSSRRADVPAALELLVMRCLEKEPARRPRGAREILGELQNPAMLSGAPLSRSARSKQTSDAVPSVFRRVAEAARRFRDEVRFAARGLRRTPTVTVSAVISLALGLGVTAAIFSAVDRALLQPLAFHEPDRLITVYRTTPQFRSGPFSPPNFLDLAKATGQATELAALTPNSALVDAGTMTVRASRQRVTGNLLPMLGVRPLHGRLIGPADDSTGRNRVVMLSEELWREQFNADTTLVSKSIKVDGEAATVIGILPAEFRIPHGWQALRAGVWEPMRFSSEELTSRRSNFLFVVGRLASRASPALADVKFRKLFEEIIAVNPEMRGESVRALSLQSEGVANVRKPLLLLSAAVTMVLLIAATNVACLLLARSVHRQRELAIRTALGASRWATMRPVFAESVLLALVGALLALGLAVAGVRVIGSLAAQRIPQLAGLTVDWRVTGFSILLSLIVAVLCGLVPAWRSTRADPQDAMRSGRGGGTARKHHRALGALIVAEGALSLVLLISAGLVLRGFMRILNNDPGFDPAPLLTMEVSISPAAYPDSSSVRRFLEPALAAIEEVPGVRRAGSISLMPYRDWGWNFNIRYEGQSADNPTKRPLVDNRTVTPSFFQLTGQRLVSGRLLNSSDDESPGRPIVVVANEALVRRDFGGRDPIGKRFYIEDDSAFATIVGVVSDIRNYGPVEVPQPEVYWSYRQRGRDATGFNLIVQVESGDPGSVAGGVHATIRSIDRTAAITRVMPMEAVISSSVGRPRFLLSMLGVFAIVAVALAVAGLYGVLSYAVAQRSRELGIRAALGGTPSQMMALVMRRGAALTAGGIAIGLVASVAATRVMSSIILDTPPRDPVAWSVATLVLVFAGLLATLGPAYRAARVDPSIAMRAE